MKYIFDAIIFIQIIIFLIVVIKHYLLINKYNKLYIYYANLVYKWNDLVLNYNNIPKVDNNEKSISISKKEAKFILKKIHSDITKSKSNDVLVAKLIKSIIICNNILEFEIVCPICGQKTMITNEEMIDCLRCGNEIPEHIDNVWKEYNKLSKQEIINLIK
jgi:hypothetical protein